MTPLLDLPPRAVLAHFAPHTDGLMWTHAPAGFSGARVWCGAADAPRVALKSWPKGTSPERVLQIHAWLAKTAHLPFVPTVLGGNWGRTVFAEGEGVWDCCRWMPGAPRTTPAAAEVSLGCEAIAHLHTAWAVEGEIGPCPGVWNRLRALAEYESVLALGPGALPPVSPLLDPLLRRAVVVTARFTPFVAEALGGWVHRTLTLHPCVRDLRGEHVLFENDRVSGIIDFGAMAVDHPAVDLARWLGDVANETTFNTGLNAYRCVRVLDAPDELVRLLARTGLVCSLLVWLVRLVVRREPFPDLPAVAQRLAVLITQCESLEHL